jgi:hypothetical protein
MVILSTTWTGSAAEDAGSRLRAAERGGDEPSRQPEDRSEGLPVLDLEPDAATGRVRLGNEAVEQRRRDLASKPHAGRQPVDRRWSLGRKPRLLRSPETATPACDNLDLP